MDKVNRQVTVFWSFLFLSFIVVALGQPAWVGPLGFVAAFLGYALFWAAMLHLPSYKQQFFLAWGWFSCVQAVQLSWMTATKYQGPYILIVYAFLCLAIGLQFAFLSFIVSKLRPLSFLKILGVSGVWVLFEWSRLFFISGFGWNPVALSLLNHHWSLQFSTLMGTYGLSFWVILVNLIGLKALFLEKGRKWLVTWLFLGFVPYLFGLVNQTIREKQFKETEPLSVLLIQTALLPEEKEPFPPFVGSAIAPISQWYQILRFAQEKSSSDIDLVVLPEVALPYGAYRGIYSLDNIKSLWVRVFGKGSNKNLPEIKPPYAFERESRYGSQIVVTNLFIAQALANQLRAEVIIGLDARDLKTKKLYNSAFFFRPFESSFSSYEKQVLVPLGEYIPYEWATNLAKKFGIVESFSPGDVAKVFVGTVPIGVSICNEETYPYIVREIRKLGANFLVNISNDVWFPDSKLPIQHFEHGRLRAAENGVSLVRACNTGVTGAIDCFGRVIGTLEVDTSKSQRAAGALFLNVPTNQFSTPYTLYGESLIVILSLFLAGSLLFYVKK